MTIHLGCMADNKTTYSFCKTQGQFAAGAVLSGFGTNPLPGAVCDDAIQKAVVYAAQWLQKVFDAMLEHQVEDLAYAQEVLTIQLGKLNNGITYLSRNFGQGIYLSGSISYVAGETFICLPFGGGSAYLLNGGMTVEMKNKAQPNPDPLYIFDAIGGANTLAVAFDKASLSVGNYLILSSRPLQDELLRASFFDLAALTDPQYAAESIYKAAFTQDMPLAIATIAPSAL